ncbi:uncharacterized protein gsdmea isoform X2 [Colossoma macropomum]|uniref:uncharacterized protein gsdmea isoform X2 n=1 Tax=Colossoma macropomum TaxID=42526 RepID=UPI001864CB90|nr:uncharacterized protein gsdmea isoform X2 [Colossoma macropomum]
MFGKATHRLLHQTDEELEGAEFLKYKAKHESVVGGSMDTGIVGFNVKAQGHCASKLSSSLGTLHKEKVNMQRLLQDSKSRKVDCEHKLIEQTWGKTQQAFTVLIERIFTTCDCTIEYSGVEEGGCSTMLKALGFHPAEVCLKESSSLQYDTNVAIEIPPQTVLAYNVTSLDIKSDGHYELSAYPDGFESDDDFTKPSLHSEEQVDGLPALPKIPEGSSLSVLREVLSGVKASLLVLAHLPAQSRSSILFMFRKILKNRALLSTLEDKLEDLLFMLRAGEASCLAQGDDSNELIDTFLDQLQPLRSSTDEKLSTTPISQNGSPSALSCPNGAHTSANKNGTNYNGTSSVASYLNGSSSKRTDQNGSHLAQSSQNGASIKLTKHSQSVLTATHMLVTAAEGLTNDGLILLESLCFSEVLNGLNDLVNLLTEDSQPLPINSLPSPLQNEDVFLKVNTLFSSSKVMLKREKKLWAETESCCEHLPLMLCIVIHGLAYLSEAQT